MVYFRYYVEYHQNCHYELIWSVGGCLVPRLAHLPIGYYDTSYKSIFGIFDQTDLMAAIPSFYPGELTLSWDVILLNQGSTMMFGGYFLNSKVFLDPDRNLYCTCPTYENGIVYSFSSLKGFISMSEPCTGIEQIPDFSFPILTPETCKLVYFNF